MMPHERHARLSRLIDRSIAASITLVVVVALAGGGVALGLLRTQEDVAEAYALLMDASALSDHAQTMTVSLADWTTRGDPVSAETWERASADASKDLAALGDATQTDAGESALVQLVATNLAHQVGAASPLPAFASAEGRGLLGTRLASADYRAHTTAIEDALRHLRAMQMGQLARVHGRELTTFAVACVVLFSVVVWATLALLRSHRAARALVGTLQDAFVSLELSRSELVAFTNAAPMGVFHTDPGGKVTWLNAHARDLLDTGSAADLPAAMFDALHPQDRARMASAWRGLIERGERFDHAFRFSNERNKARWAEAHAVPVEVNGNITGHVAVVQDVTAKRGLQKELGRSQTRLQRMMDAVPALLAHIDATETYRFVNSTYASWFGKACPRAGTTVHEFLGDAGYAKLKPAINTVLSGRPTKLEVVQEDLHGRAFVGDMTYTPEFDEAGNVCGFYVLVTDITDRKQLEDSLYASKEMAQVTLDSIGDGVITTDAAGLVMFVNQRAEQLLGRTLGRISGLPVDEVVRLIDSLGRAVPTSLLDAIRQDATVDGLQLRSLLLPAGKQLPVEDIASPIRSREGKVVGGVLVLRDVSTVLTTATQMRHLGEADPLTGLAGRTAFEERLTRLVQSCAMDETFAVLRLDIDGIGAINDTHGHAAGDEVLKAWADRFATIVDPADTLCRLGGGQFAAVLAPSLPRDDLFETVSRLMEAASMPHMWNGVLLEGMPSAGLAIAPRDGNDAESLLRKAGHALREARQARKNQVRAGG